MPKPIPVMEHHIDTAGPTWTPFHSREGCASLLRNRYRNGLLVRLAPHAYALSGCGCDTYVLTQPKTPEPRPYAY